MKLGTRTWSGIAAAVAVIGLGALAIAQPPRGGPPGARRAAHGRAARRERRAGHQGRAQEGHRIQVQEALQEALRQKTTRSLAAMSSSRRTPRGPKRTRLLEAHPRVGLTCRESVSRSKSSHFFTAVERSYPGPYPPPPACASCWPWRATAAAPSSRTPPARPSALCAAVGARVRRAVSQAVSDPLTDAAVHCPTQLPHARLW